MSACSTTQRVQEPHEYCACAHLLLTTSKLQIVMRKLQGKKRVFDFEEPRSPPRNIPLKNLTSATLRLKFVCPSLIQEHKTGRRVTKIQRIQDLSAREANPDKFMIELMSTIMGSLS